MVENMLETRQPIDPVNFSLLTTIERVFGPVADGWQVVIDSLAVSSLADSEFEYSLWLVNENDGETPSDDNVLASNVKIAAKNLQENILGAATLPGGWSIYGQTNSTNRDIKVLIFCGFFINKIPDRLRNSETGG